MSRAKVWANDPQPIVGRAKIEAPLRDWSVECNRTVMLNSRSLLILPLLFLAVSISQCSRPEQNSKDIPALEKKGTNIDGNPATGAAPAPGALPSGISASGDQENRP